jgi:hypothetical protein
MRWRRRLRVSRAFRRDTARNLAGPCTAHAVAEARPCRPLLCTRSSGGTAPLCAHVCLGAVSPRAAAPALRAQRGGAAPRLGLPLRVRPRLQATRRCCSAEELTKALSRPEDLSKGHRQASLSLGHSRPRGAPPLRPRCERLCIVAEASRHSLSRGTSEGTVRTVAQAPAAGAKISTPLAPSVVSLSPLGPAR